MPKLTPAQIQKAHRLFLIENRGAAIRISCISQTEADALGMELADLQESRLIEEMDAYARSKGFDPLEYRFSLAAADRAEFDALMASHKAEQKRILDLD